MEYTQEELQEMVQGIAPEVLEQEAVYGGFRPLHRSYSMPDRRIVYEWIAYEFSPESDAWASVLFTSLHMKDVQVQ